MTVIDKTMRIFAYLSLVLAAVFAIFNAVDGRNPVAAMAYVWVAAWVVFFLTCRDPEPRPVYIPVRPEWVNVEARLPFDELDDYVMKHDEFPGFIVMIKDATEPTQLYFDGEKWFDENEYTYTVTHWMNMPEVPETEGI